jgi:Flp pilus assembly protein TadG
MSARTRGGERGQSLVEFALYLPLLSFFLFGCFQFAVLFFDYLSVMNAARDIGRWLVVHPNTVDATATAMIRGRLPSNLDSAQMNIAISPACTTLTQGKCANRATGSRLAVTFTYDVRSHLFLPQTFGIGSNQISFPSTLPSYTLHMAVEPS